MSVTARIFDLDATVKHRVAWLLGNSDSILNWLEHESAGRGGGANLNKREIVISIWRDFGEPRVGERELRRVQKALAEGRDPNDALSPAAIARILADQGAELRHPEIIEFDARWREAQIKARNERFKELEEVSAQPPLSLEQAEALINELERLRQRFVSESDREDLADLTSFAAQAREAAQSLSRTRTLDAARRMEQAEIAEWLKLWIQNPTVFIHWLALRKRSPEFRDRFGAE
jgi:hypothetical protein